MSVWRSPCYNIEAPRNTINNYPAEFLSEFPDEFEGIFNFCFGDCEDYHPEYSGKHAATLFKDDNRVWKEFVDRTRRTGSGDSADSYKFRATVCATKVKYSGIKAVYWAYKEIAEGRLKLKNKLDEKILNSFTRELWSYMGPASRTNEVDWEAAGETLWGDASEEGYKTPAWFQAEGDANAFNYLWTSNNSPSYRREKARSRIMVRESGSTIFYTQARPIPKEKSISKAKVPDIFFKSFTSATERYRQISKYIYNTDKLARKARATKVLTEAFAESQAYGESAAKSNLDDSARGASKRRVEGEAATVTAAVSPNAEGTSPISSDHGGTTRGDKTTGEGAAAKSGRAARHSARRRAFRKLRRVEPRSGPIGGRRELLDGEDTVPTFPRRLLREVEVVPFVIVNNEDKRWKLFRFDGGYILYDEVSDESGIFYTKDHNRLAQMLKSRAQLIKYYTNYAVNDTELNRLMSAKFYELEAMFLKSLDTNDPDFCNWVCRACDVTQFKYLASLANDVNERALADQNNKIEKEKLSKYFPIDLALKVVQDDRIGIKEELELLKFYKLFPCPDFCIYSAVSSFKKKSSKPNPCTWKVRLKVVNGPDYSTSKEEFHSYTMRNRLIMFKETHGYLPGKVERPSTVKVDVDPPEYLRAYPDIDPIEIKLEDIKWINFKGTFLYRRYDGCEDELVKDKSTAGKIVEDAKWSGNQVLEYLFRDDFKRQAEINKAFAEGRVPDISKMEILLRFKAEAKKPGSRLFSMATDEQRRQLSELEANISLYAKNCRGSSQGKSDIDMNASLTAIATTISTTFEELLISFDLEAFSPKMSPEFKKFQYETWAYCFGESDILPTYSIFTDNTVKVDLFGLDDTWKLAGNDLEGFNARLNTVMHAEVMGYCVYKLKQLGIIPKQSSANLEALIDDGLLKLYFSKISYRKAMPLAVSIIERIYASFGLIISWDKTFVSQVMCQYLNRVFYDGAEVTPGVKAFMRIGKVEEMPIPSIIDELEAVAASARGAIKSGTDHRLAYWAYIWEFTMTLVKWSNYDWGLFKSHDLAFRCLFPTSFGGFAISSLYGLATNSSFNSTVACLANIRMLVFNDPARTAYVNKILNAGVRKMTDEELLRAPTAIRSVYRTINSRRFANNAKAFVMSHSVNPFLRHVVRRLTSTESITMAEVIAGLTVINEFQRSRLAKMDPKDFLEKVVKKLQNSSTAARMLGPGKVIALTMVNKSEARALISEAARGEFKLREVRSSFV